MFKNFYPGDWMESTYVIDFEGLYKEGKRGLIFDIDNTLVEHDQPADLRAKELFERLKKLGFSCCLLSNNQRARVESFNRELGVYFIENAHKPRVKNYRKAMEVMGTDEKNTVFVGDQIFTDIYGANRAGIPSILVSPIDPKEEIQIVLKRYLERIVLWFYMREKRRGRKQ